MWAGYICLVDATCEPVCHSYRFVNCLYLFG